MSEWLENSLAVLMIILALSYFGYRFFWGGKWFAAVIQKNEAEQDYARSRSVDKIMWALLIACCLILILYYMLKS